MKWLVENISINTLYNIYIFPYNWIKVVYIVCSKNRDGFGRGEILMPALYRSDVIIIDNMCSHQVCICIVKQSLDELEIKRRTCS